jgi:exportin-2 (importin alpha re-exporter)
MASLPALLQASLSPDTRKQAEATLNQLCTDTSFLSHLLRLVLDTTQDRAIRLAGSIFLKNVVKTKWDEVCSEAAFCG